MTIIWFGLLFGTTKNLNAFFESWAGCIYELSCLQCQGVILEWPIIDKQNMHYRLFRINS